jgi:2-polyprenyl-3-methyl-5-hydroxy-6-metoxy-1,4-benzoquinol methylase
MKFSQVERHSSNKKARSTWERKAVGSHRANADAGTAEYFSQIRKYRYEYETPFIPEVFQYKTLKNKRVLEIGVGNGIDAVEMLRNGACYSGIDVTENHLKLTKRYVELERRAGRIMNVEEIVKGDLLEYDLIGNYNVIYSFGVLHHITHEEEILRRLKSLLSENGELRFAVYARFSFFNIWMITMWIFQNRMKNSLKDWQSHLAEGSFLGDPVVIKLRNKSEIQSMLEKTGFTVINYSKKGFVQGYIPFLGKYLNPNGWVLNKLGSLLGWYHCFTCR